MFGKFSSAEYSCSSETKNPVSFEHWPQALLVTVTVLGNQKSVTLQVIVRLSDDLKYRAGRPICRKVLLCFAM